MTSIFTKKMNGNGITQMVDIKSDLFIIPNEQNSSIIYSPLRGIAFLADEEATGIIRSFKNGIKPPEEVEQSKLMKNLRHLSAIEPCEPEMKDLYSLSADAVFILSQICNLNCSYCYAKNFHENEIISFESVKNVIDSKLKNPERKAFSFSFIGGGEPLVTWNLLTKSIDYIVKISKEKKVKTNIGIATNGTLLSKKKIEYLKKNNIRISISFDILPDVQNKQRPFPNPNKKSFDIVDKNIKLLISAGIIPRIRSTITKESVDKMPEMVNFVRINYPQIKSIHLEPVTDKNQNTNNFFDRYLSSFIKAKRIADSCEIQLKNSITHSFSRIRSRFCNGEFCITSNSDIVACHRISSNREEGFNQIAIGKVNNKVEINNKRKDETLLLFEKKLNDCENCFAKWHCAGGCTMFNVTSTEKEILAYCNFTRNSIKFLLQEKIITSLNVGIR